MLTLGWSDGATFLPIDFALLSSKNCLNGISEHIDKPSSGYRRRAEALKPDPEVIPIMIQRALDSGKHASYILMDTWFTQQPLIKAITDQGLEVIGMVKNLKQRYMVNEFERTLPFRYTINRQKSSSKFYSYRSSKWCTCKNRVFP